MTQPNYLASNSSLFKLEYPQSVGLYDTYPEAQKAVDFLADQNFPVANLAIVGTDLKLMERVTGRKTWGTVLTQGVMSGLSTGFIVAIMLMIFFPRENFVSQLLTALLIGVSIGLLFAVLGHAMSRGQRDFTSISQTVATKYEILCEHKVAGQAREVLARMPGTRAAQFDPRTGPAQPWQQAPYPPQAFPPGGYPPQQGGYPQQGYPTPQGGYPQQGGYPYGQPGYGQPAPGEQHASGGQPAPAGEHDQAQPSSATPADPDAPYRRPEN